MRPLDSTQMLYHTASGDTHALNPVAAEAIDQLRAGPLDAGELSRRVAAALGGEADEQFVGRIDELLRHFDELGLIEAVP